MDVRRRTTTVRQLQLLVEFAEANRDLALGRLRSKEARALSKRLWSECADSLNSEGPARQPKEWTKVWNDMKSRVRGKLTTLTLSQRGTGGGPYVNVALTELEEKVAEIIGRDIGPIPNVAQDPFLQAPPEENQPSVVEDVVLEDIGLNMEQHVSNEVNNQLQLNMAGPSSRSLPYRSPPRPAESTSRPTTPPPPRQSQPPSASSTPRPQRQRPRQRPYMQRTSRVHSQAQTSRSALDESRAMVVRMEELRARTEYMLAQSALKQAEAAKAQAEAAVILAEANRLSAQTMSKITEAVCSLMPAVQHWLHQSDASRRTQMLSSTEELENIP